MKAEAALAAAEQQRDEYKNALEDELDNWNPERRPNITAERDAALERVNQLEKALGWFASEEAWTVTPDYMADGRYRFNTTPESVFATPWGFAREVFVCYRGGR